MKRENVLVSEDALARQREFEAKIKEMFTAREAHPVACVDTFGCQQNVADGERLMGMLREMGCEFTDDTKRADIVLMKSDLLDAAAAVELSKATIRNIKQNLFWAFFYNAIGIPLAAGVLYPALGITLNPMIAAAAMSLSSVCVVSNALRLRGWKAPARPNDIPEQNHQTESEEEATMQKVMTIEGMMCTHCSGRVESALNAIPGVTAKVDLEKKTATVSGEVSDDTLRKAVEDAGYQVVSIQ